MGLNRKPNMQETKLLEHLIKQALIAIPADWKEDLLVSPADDGGMGSLNLMPKGVSNESRIFGKQISEFQFQDRDGVKVIVSLNVDDKGELFELDIWKTDFSKLIQFPNI